MKTAEGWRDPVTVLASDGIEILMGQHIQTSYLKGYSCDRSWTSLKTQYIVTKQAPDDNSTSFLVA